MNDWKEMSEDEQTREVYAHAGLALYWAQCFEMSLSNFLLLMKRMDGDLISESEFNSYEAGLQKQTLGKLLNSVRKIAVLDDKAFEFVNAALDKRNFIAHHYFRERAEGFFSGKGKSAMIDELIHIQNVFRRADAVGSSLAGAVGMALGITEEHIETELEAMKARHASP